jgi:competence protein ComEC
VTACALPLIALLVLAPERPVTSPARLEITAVDVGQGDSILAVNPEGAAMLIDAGGPVGSRGPAEVVANFDVGEEVVSPYLWSRRLRRLDVVVLSHAHTDHMGGMPAILENFRPRELWVSIDPHSRLYAGLLDQAKRLGIRVRHLHAGDLERWGSVSVSVLAPGPAYGNANAPKNDDSLVLEMRYGKASALLEGDAETPSEHAMLAAGLVHPVTLLKVGHHGSRTSSTQAFLDAAAPREAVISVGRRNTFGHPRPEVIGRLAAGHAHLFRTDEFGLTSFLLGADGSVQEVVDGQELPAHQP